MQPTTLDTGLLFEDIRKTNPKIEGTFIEEFAKTWAAAYRRGEELSFHIAVLAACGPEDKNESDD